MKSSFYFITFLSIFILGCSKISDKIIDKDTIVNDYADLKTEQKLTEKQENILNLLENLAKGRSQFIKERDLDENAVKILVDEDEFNKVTTELFDEFKKSGITYNELLEEITNYEKDEKSGKEKLDSLYLLVDKECQKIQNEVDSLAQEINKYVEFKLQNIKSGTHSYRDYVGVSILATNKSGKTVEAVSFNLTLYDKLDQKITTLILSSSKRFNNSTNLYYEYEEYDYDRRDIYKALEQTTMRRIGRVEQNIRRINLDGQILGKDQINFEYKTPETLFGYCPYLEKDHELLNAITDQEIKNQEILNSYKTIKKITDVSKSLINYENIKKSLSDALKGY